MAVKKSTSRTRSAKAKTTTKAAKTTRSTTKRATKSKTVAKRAPVAYVPTPAASHAAIAEPARPESLKPTVKLPVQTQPKPAKAVTSTEPRPSQFTAEHYIHAKGPEPAEGAPRKAGKWMIFVSRSRVDALWEAIRREVVAGRLGHAAKVSTALPDPLSPDPKKHMICVYTPNEDDVEDVRRVRGALRALGVTWKIPYKSDAPALAGQYEGMAGPAAKHYE
jgi:hypothetical protein